MVAAMLIDWLAAGLKKPGKSKSGLAKKLGRAPSAVSQILNGARGIKANELALIADYIDEPIPALSGQPAAIKPKVVLDRDFTLSDDALDVRGDVAGGVWMEIDPYADAGNFEKANVVYSPRWPKSAQYALRVRGTSINRQARDGDYLRCIDLGIAGIEPRDGDLVIVEQRRADGLREVTAKVLRRNGAQTILEPDSDDPKWKPIVLDGENPVDGVEVAIIAVVDLRFSPMRGW